MNCIVRRAALVAGLSLVTLVASAQQAPAHAAVPSWMAPPLAAQTAADPNAATATYTGTFVLNFTITIKSIVPGAVPIHCTGIFSPLDASSLNYSDYKTVVAVRSGNTATCALSVPYSWVLANASALVSTQYIVGTEGTGSSLVMRQASGSLGTVTLPANTTTLTRSVAVTI